MFAVEWIPSAVGDLTTFWLDGTPNEREAITRASREIDSLLRLDPEDAGESRSEGRRILLVAPLSVIFKVEPLDRKVRVLKVWQYKKRDTDE